ncbi:MAG: tetratricopeptide repeat protein [Acaryochloridaceae cyanobacterium RU_4_10]|nr:tetratricopeptide repeat protein [Acaryochloridaceae cyanobacterium RU_4_10]
MQLDPKTSLAITYKCMAFAALQKYEEALDTCTFALKVDGNWGRFSPALAWLQRGILLSGLTQYEQAIIAYDRTLLLQPKDSLTLAYRCEAFTKLNQNEPAIDSCDRALAGNGKWGDKTAAFAWINRGVAHRQLKQWEKAIADYDRAINIEPNDPLTWAAQGFVFEKLARFNESLTSYDRALQISPKFSLALVGRCTMLNQLTQYKEALEACEQSLQGDGNWIETGPAQAWNQRGKALTGLEKYEEALASANRAVGIKPDYPEAWSDRGAILWYLRKYEEALDSTQRSIQLNPNNAKAWLNQGIVLRAMGQPEEALKTYDKALQLDPTDAETWVNQSVALLDLGRLQAALSATDNALRFNPKSFMGWYNRGVALVKLRQYQEAFLAYEKAAKVKPDSADALTGLGISLFFLKRYPDAVLTLQAALKLNPNQGLAQEALKNGDAAANKKIIAVTLLCTGSAKCDRYAPRVCSHSTKSSSAETPNRALPSGSSWGREEWDLRSGCFSGVRSGWVRTAIATHQESATKPQDPTD